MEPFRSPQPACTRCGAPRPDHLSPQGELVCRACAVLSAADAQLAQGRRAGVAGAVVGLVFGVVLVVGSLFWGVPILAGSGRHYELRMVSRVLGLGLSLGIAAIVVSWRNYRTFSARKG
jgi:hypothetical protein